MADMRALVERMRRDFLPRLAPGDQSIVNSELDFSDDIDMALDDMLQFSLVSDVPMPTDMVDEAEAVLNSGDCDPELADRTRGWINQHRTRLAAA